MGLGPYITYSIM